MTTLREMGVFEKMLNNSFVIISSISEVEGITNMEYLESSLKACTQKHPHLRIQMKDDTFIELKENIFIKPEYILLKESGNWKEILENLINHLVFEKDLPLWKVFVISDNKDTKLCVTIHHSICDGTGVFALTDDILNFYHQAENGCLKEQESLKMLPHAEDYYFNGNLDEKKLEDFIKKEKTHTDTKLNYNQTKETGNGCLFHSGSSENYENIIKKCKEEKVTIGCMIFASCLFVVSRKIKDFDFPLDILVNFRDKGNPKLGIEYVALLIGIMTLNVKFSLETNFWDLCKKIQENLGEELKIESPYYWHPIRRSTSTIRLSEISISNVGPYKLPLSYGNVKLKRIYGVTTVPSWPYFFLIMSFKEFNYSFVYQKAISSKSDAESFFKEIYTFIEVSHKLPKEFSLKEFLNKELK